MEDKLKTLVFHNYVPKDENLKRLVRSNLEDYTQIEEDIDAVITRIIDEYSNKVRGHRDSYTFYKVCGVLSHCGHCIYFVTHYIYVFRACRPLNNFQDVLSLVLPSNQNLDLKRNLRDARQLLANKTDQTIMKLLKTGQTGGEIGPAMLAKFSEDAMERELSDEDN